MRGTCDLEVGHVRSMDDPTLKDDPDDSPSAEGRKREKTRELLERDLELKYTKIWTLGGDSMNIRKPSCQRKVLLMLSVLTVSLDPLFFYIPMINMDAKCLRSDKLLGIKAIVFRTLVDILYAALWMHYREGFYRCKRDNSVSFSDESPRNSITVARVAAFLSVLPLPQAVTILILSMKGSPRAPHAVTLLKFTVLCQFILRAVRIFPTFRDATRNSYSLLMNRVWVGAGFNLILFMISSHVVGAFWYLLAVGRTMDCWKSACKGHPRCQVASLYCNGSHDELGNKGFLNDSCTIKLPPDKMPFDFGIYLPALQTNIVGSTNFLLKISYCFWWGLRNLSSLGQNLTTSAHEWEICFSICISILGLILFSLFIGNMQTYFQSKTKRELEKMQDKLKKKTEKIISKQRRLSDWEALQVLSPELREQIESCREKKWVESEDINLNSILQSLPKKLSKKLKTELCNNALWKLKKSEGGNEAQVEALYDLARLETFSENNCIFMPRSLIDKTILIVSGHMNVTDHDGSTTTLSCGDSIGEQLLEQVIADSTTLEAPVSTVTVVAVNKVEAFVISINDLRYLGRYNRVLLSVARKFLWLRRRKPENSASSRTRKWPKYFRSKTTSL